MSGPLLLPTWEQLATAKPQLVDTMRRYLQQVACVLRPGSVSGTLALRSFTASLVDAAPGVTSVADATRRHIEDYRPWLAARPGQNKARVSPATLAHRLGTLRMFFLRIEWAWPEAPARVPMFPGDLPRLDRPLPKALDDATAAKLLRAAQNDKWLLCGSPWKGCCAPDCGSASTPACPPTPWCRSAPHPGCRCRSESSPTTATCRCTPT